MQPTGRRDGVKFHDILILIITGNADSPGRVWWGVEGKGYGSKMGKIHDNTGNYCNDNCNENCCCK